MGIDRVQQDKTVGVWQDLPSRRVLDTDFNDGQHFLTTWWDWLQDSRRPHVLHYVALCPSAPDPQNCLHHADQRDGLHALGQELVSQWFGLLPGFHRFLLSEGRVILTLCVGDALQSLRQQAFQADDVLTCIDGDATLGAFDAQSLWHIKALARCCRRGTQLRGRATAPPHRCAEWCSHLKSCGFESIPPEPAPDAAAPDPLALIFNPPWTLKNTRQLIATEALPVQRCVVIGAGLAGASVAASLARRGWQVHVLDQAQVPATGASGLPVGLVFPHVSSDDCSLSRLSRAGVRLTLQQARQHLQEDLDWSPSGVLERQIGGTPQLPKHWPLAGKDWSMTSAEATTCSAAPDIGSGLWHNSGAWLKPAALVRAWLNLPGVTFQGQACAHHLHHDNGVWHVLDAQGALLCRAECVVFANACGARELLQTCARHLPELEETLQRLPATQGMRGLLSWAEHADSPDAVFPAFPVNGAGSLISHVPLDAGTAWFAGSSYQPAHQPERSDADNHAHNLGHLQQLAPDLAAALRPVFESETLQAWKGTRCVSTDRMPLVGPLDSGPEPSLWLCAALGSRGLSFSVLCAELLAARMGAEPLPVEANLAKVLDALRA